MPFCLGTVDKHVKLKCFLLPTYPTEKATLGYPVHILPSLLQKTGYQIHSSLQLWGARLCWVSPVCYLSVLLSIICHSHFICFYPGLYKYQYSILYFLTLPTDFWQERHACLFVSCTDVCNSECWASTMQSRSAYKGMCVCVCVCMCERESDI